MQTITVESVTARDGTRPWKIHSNGDEYVTWEDADGQLLRSLQGMVAEIEFEARTKTRDGRTYTDKVITSVTAPGELPPSHRQDEPNVNTAKQIVIIRQNAWGQTNEVYATALAYLRAGGGGIDPDAALTPEMLESAATDLLPGMMKIAHGIEQNLRRYWFPPDTAEEPF